MTKKVVVVELKPEVFLAVDLEEEDIEELKDLDVNVIEPPVEKDIDTIKKGFAFLIPVIAVLPSTAVIIGTATLGIVGGAASVVGGKIINKIWK